ncbi:MAG: hypothetical protein HZA53_11110 [Planctomycetes bacterium]|nr:hypothetical protein [Planctomycetota bacterium]
MTAPDSRDGVDGGARCAELVALARTCIPPYRGRERDHLSSTELPLVEHAIELYESVLERASEVYLGEARVRHDLVHALVLLGNDRRYRGLVDLERVAFRRALEVSRAALERNPDDAWLHYKQGIAHRALLEPEAAVTAFDRAMAAGERISSAARVRPVEPELLASATDVRMRASFERAASLMRCGSFERARIALDALNAEPGNDHLREGIHRSLAHLSACCDDPAGARAHLRQAVGSAVDHTYAVQPLLESWILAADDRERAECAASMRDLLEHAPWVEDELRWERVLMAFDIGMEERAPRRSESESSSRTPDPAVVAAHADASCFDDARPESLASCAEAEERRRNDDRARLPQLRAAAWLHAGVALELLAERASAPEQRAELQERSRAAYDAVLTADVERAWVERTYATWRRARLDAPRHGKG